MSDTARLTNKGRYAPPTTPQTPAGSSSLRAKGDSRAQIPWLVRIPHTIDGPKTRTGDEPASRACRP
ncbi:hypothetical protein FRC08_016137 [Ceratobasidium sp. 394]|nr:hypothetical protein FRC08_016137 [Ceratobasidium sp. 394]KAG9096645.1 hypothetical protein FS749_008060 [Ceratobasidium sp. UAMH 11750]